MKKYLFFFSFIIYFHAVIFAQTYSGKEAWQLIPGTDFITKGPNSGIPTYIRFAKGLELSYPQFELWLSERFKVGQGLGIKLIKTESDELGFTHYRYQQTYQGYPIFGNTYIVHVKNGYITCMNGSLADKSEAPVRAAISEKEALSKALLYINAKSYMWQYPDEEKALRYAMDDQKATYYPKGELVVISADDDQSFKNYRLCYQFDVYAHYPLSRNYVFVDAENGQIIRKIDRIYDDKYQTNVNAAATAATKYSGSRSIMTDYTGTTYRLRETGRGNGIETYNLQLGTNYGAAVDFTNATTTWTGTNANKDEVARDAHWGAEKTWDYYYNIHGRNSVDNAGLKLLGYVHANLVGMGYTDNVNAFWDGTRMTYGDGDATYNPLTTLDVCGHEITHGVTGNTANLTYQNESGAMNEGFSDIFGTCIEFYAKPPLQTGNWTIAEDCGPAFRSMSNPNLYQQPDTYQGTYWYVGTQDNGGVHTNSGVLNYWFYLLCQGGSGTNDIGNAFNVTGITIAEAQKIAYRTLTVYLTASSQYADARTASIQASSDLYGGCSQETQSTTNAWYAVGVGAAYVATPVHADFSACPTTQCANAPFAVQFTNSSTNGNTYLWYFGDGTTSTATSPSHTYNTNGSYNVKLVANGGTCGLDSITKNAYITVGPSYPCAVSVPATGTGTTQTNCTGTLYDSGLCGDYTNNTNGTITISPPGALTVTLTFTSFNFETNYDFLYIYNGPTTGSPQFTGSPFTGTTIPGTITSTGGSITLRQTSDAGVVASGFSLNWSCSTAASPPVANFSANKTSSCNGTISFTDLSTNAPTAWLWDFGDGQTSNTQNPSHTYTSNGTFSVTLTATNQYGSDTITKQNYITITMPNAPSTTGASRCGTGTVTLSASGAGTLLWFNAPTGGTLVHTGTTYTTPSLSTTTNYYVQDSVAGATHHCAKTDNTGGGGYTSTGTHYLKFSCFTPLTLVSVKIYGNTPAPGNRTITLNDHTGTQLQTATLNILSGLNTYTLNFPLPADTGLRLQCSDGTNIYRNNAGVTYPYTTAGYISVINSDVGSAYYYYLYDWIVQEPGCNSPRTIVTATINQTPVAPVSVSAAPSTICSGSATTLSATGGSGTTLHWYTVSCGGTSVGTGNNLSVSPTSNTTYYARWENTCGNSTCQSVPVTVNAAPVAPVSVSANPSDICAGMTTTLTATGGSGTTLNWLADSCNGISAGTGNNLVVTPATGTTYYARWETANCGVSICNNVSVTIDPVSVGGVATPSVSSICSGNITTINLSGQTGNIQWQTNASGTWQDIPGQTGTSYTTPNLTVTTSYRAIVTSGTCSSAMSNTVTISVVPSSVAGTATPLDSAICSGSGTSIALSGNSGNIQWQILNGSTWQSIAGETGTTLVIQNLTSTALYRAIVTAGGCPADSSNDVLINVIHVSVGGTTTPFSPQVCSGHNTTIHVAGQTGTIQWQTDAGGSWQDIPGATGTLYTTPGLTSITSFRAVVTNGICSADTSTVTTITIVSASTDPVSITGDTLFCAGNGTLLTVTGGILGGGAAYQWGTGQTCGSNIIAGAVADTLSTGNLTTTATYWVRRTGGTCAITTSCAFVTVDVIALPVATIVPQGPTAVCEGEFVVLAAPSNPGYTYSWSFNGTPIPGANQQIYSVFQSGSYTVEITNTCGSDLSSPQFVSVSNPPAPMITQQNDTLFSNAPMGNQWYLDGNPISGATNSYYVPAAEGNYSVVVTDTNGCISDTSNSVHYIPAGLAENNDTGIKIWPNPTKGVVNIDYYGLNVKELVLTLTDVPGRILIKEKLSAINNGFHHVVDLSKYSRGCYFISLENEGSSIQKKIIIN